MSFLKVICSVFKFSITSSLHYIDLLQIIQVIFLVRHKLIEFLKIIILYPTWYKIMSLYFPLLRKKNSCPSSDGLFFLIYTYLDQIFWSGAGLYPVGYHREKVSFV